MSLPVVGPSEGQFLVIFMQQFLSNFQSNVLYTIQEIEQAKLVSLQ